MKSIGTDAEPIEVLLVEDSPGDVRLTQEAFKDAKVHINLHVAWDGAEAMAFLRQERELRIDIRQSTGGDRKGGIEAHGSGGQASI